MFIMKNKNLVRIKKGTASLLMALQLFIPFSNQYFISSAVAAMASIPYLVQAEVYSNVRDNPNYNTFKDVGADFGSEALTRGKLTMPSSGNDTQMNFANTITNENGDQIFGGESLELKDIFNDYNPDDIAKLKQDGGAIHYGEDEEDFQKFVQEKTLELSDPANDRVDDPTTDNYEGSFQGEAYRMMTSQKTRIKPNLYNDPLVRYADEALTTMEQNNGFTTCSVVENGETWEDSCKDDNITGQCGIKREFKTNSPMYIIDPSNVTSTDCGKGCIEMEFKNDFESTGVSSCQMENIVNKIVIKRPSKITKVTLINAEYNDHLKITAIPDYKYQKSTKKWVNAFKDIPFPTALSVKGLSPFSYDSGFIFTAPYSTEIRWAAGSECINDVPLQDTTSLIWNVETPDIGNNCAAIGKTDSFYDASSIPINASDKAGIKIEKIIKTIDKLTTYEYKFDIYINSIDNVVRSKIITEQDIVVGNQLDDNHGNELALFWNKIFKGDTIFSGPYTSLPNNFSNSCHTSGDGFFGSTALNTDITKYFRDVAPNKELALVQESYHTGTGHSAFKIRFEFDSFDFLDDDAWELDNICSYRGQYVYDALVGGGTAALGCVGEIKCTYGAEDNCTIQNGFPVCDSELRTQSLWGMPKGCVNIDVNLDTCTNMVNLQNLEPMQSCKETLTPDNKCQFIDSVCYHKEITNGICMLGESSYTCQETGTMTCKNEGDNPFIDCKVVEQEVSSSYTQNFVDQRNCTIKEAPVTGSCNLSKDVFVKNNVNPSCTESSSTICIGNKEVSVKSEMSSNVLATTFSGSYSCESIAKSQSCIKKYTCESPNLDASGCDLDTGACNNDFYFNPTTDAKGNISYQTVGDLAFDGMNAACENVRVDYECHTAYQHPDLNVDTKELCINSPSYTFNMVDGKQVETKTMSVKCITIDAGFAKNSCIDNDNDAKCTLLKNTCDPSSRDLFTGECYNSTSDYDCSESSDKMITSTIESNTCDTAPSPEQNTSFGPAYGQLAALQEMGENLDCNVQDEASVKDCRVFKGESMPCGMDPWGLRSCCDKAEGVDLNNFITQGRLAYNIHSVMSSSVLSSTWAGGTYNSYITEPVSELASYAGDWASSAYDSVSSGMSSALESLTGDAVEAAVSETATASAGTAGGAAAGGAGAATGAATDAAGEAITSKVGQFVANKAYDFLTNYMGEFGSNLAKQMFTGSTSTAAGASGNVAMTSGMSTLVSIVSVIMWIYAIYQIINMILDIIYACDAKEIEYQAKKALKSCHSLGKYCTNDTLFGCMEYARGNCCYSGPLPRILTEQIYAQLPEYSWGPADAPNCKGIKIGDLAKLDWNRVDLGEWMSIITTSGLIPDVNSMNFENMTGSSGRDIIGAVAPEKESTIDRVTNDLSGNKTEQMKNQMNEGIWNGN